MQIENKKDTDQKILEDNAEREKKRISYLQHKEKDDNLRMILRSALENILLTFQNIFMHQDGQKILTQIFELQKIVKESAQKQAEQQEKDNSHRRIHAEKRRILRELFF